MSAAEPGIQTPPTRGRKRWLWNTAGVAVALLAVTLALVLWGSSPQFERMVRSHLATQIQNATGGRVEIAGFTWRLRGLQAEADGIVIHGDESLQEAPYARIEKLQVGLSVLGFFSPKVQLRDLLIEKPQIHLIIYPDGATNQPHPSTPSKQGSSNLETLFQLKAGRIAVEQGLIDVDNRAAGLDFQDRYQPLDFRAEDASLLMQYVPAHPGAPESYHIEAGVRDLDLSRKGTAEKELPVHGVIQASVDLTRDAAYLRSMRIRAEGRGVKPQLLEITGSLSNFAKPRWEAKTKGSLDMRLLDPILGYPFAPEGIAHLDLATAGQAGEFHIDGSVHAEKASYIGTGVVARGIDLTARVHADPLELRITSVVAKLQQGGQIGGEVLLAHWLPPVPGETVLRAPAQKPPPPTSSLRKKLGSRFHRQPAPKPVAPAPADHSILVKSPKVDIPVDGRVNANFSNVTVDTILDLVSQPPFQRLGVDAVLNGPAVAVWNHGDVNALQVTSHFALTPSGHALPNESPTHGTIDATYTQRDGAVDVRNLDLEMAASRLQAHGRLGAYPITSPTALTVDFQSRDLRDFDVVLRNLGLRRNNKAGVAALPIALGGQAEFHGQWAGSLESPKLSGHALATQLTAELPGSFSNPTAETQTIHWDSVEADGSYDAERIAIVHGSLQHGNAKLQIDGTLTAPPPPIRTGKNAKRAGDRGDELPAFDANSVVHGHVQAAGVDVADLLPLTGSNLPVSGRLDAQLQIQGPVHAIEGSGWAQLNDGVIAGEPVSRLHTEGALAQQVVKLSSVQIKAPAGTVNGSGEYDLRSGHFRATARGAQLDLGNIARLRTLGEHVTGTLEFDLNASGTRNDPLIEGDVTVNHLTAGGEPLGVMSATAHTVDHSLQYLVTSQMDSAHLTLQGHTELRGDYASEGKLEFSRFDIGSLFRMAHIGGITAQSALAGRAEISGPLARPQELRGDLHLDKMAVVLAGVHLQSEAGVHATLDRMRVSLDPVHITGEDTDLRAQGGVALKEKRLDMAASGSVNLKLAETLDPDLSAAGTSTFQIEAHGALSDPELRGRVDFKGGSLSLEDIPNGLSQLQGTLEFNQNRLEVRSLTAMTGGGQLSMGGYLAYQHGLYADLSVSGKNIRIRYPQGVSSLANTDLRLQGTQGSLLLSGNVLLTRFTVSPDLDIAALAAQANTVQGVVPSNAPSNHVRLDVRIQSSPQLNFQNAYAKLAGDIDLRLRGTVASPSLLGRVSITEGNATIAGTRYELQRGQISFTNPVRIQPNIDLNATARVEDYDITLGLHGTPDKLSVSYRSDPPLPEADVVALLALGRTQSEQGIYTQQQQQSAGLSPSTDVLLGGALNATVSSRVQKLFGAGAVKVDPSYLGALGNSTTRVTVEEQLGKNVTLTYATNVNTTAQQLLQAEIAINRHLSLVVMRDESGVFSMVVRATRRYR